MLLLCSKKAKAEARINKIPPKLNHLPGSVRRRLMRRFLSSNLAEVASFKSLLRRT